METQRDIGQRRGQQAFPFLENGQPDWERISQLQAQYRNVEVPYLILWGARDEGLPILRLHERRSEPVGAAADAGVQLPAPVGSQDRRR